MRVCISAAVWLARLTLNVIYGVMKLFPVRRRVCFFSRQGNEPSGDFHLLMDRLAEECPDTEIVTICYRFEGKKDGLIGFGLATLRSMVYLATSRVCVLDTYWPAVSMLRHKKCLKVIQIWHSNGKIKQSGYQTLGHESGRDPHVARMMRMHQGYDYVIGGGPAWNRFYCESFGIREEQICNYGLPRLDWLVGVKPDMEAFWAKYPHTRGKQIVLFAPTFREFPVPPPTKLAEQFDPARYEFIYRYHPRQRFTDDGFKSRCRYNKEDIFELLKVCDWFITDYSSLALEAAVLDKPTLYYLPDDERYRAENGVNIDLFEVMPHCSFADEQALFHLIEQNAYPDGELERYRAEYLPSQLGTSTEKIVLLIKACLDGKEICDHG